MHQAVVFTVREREGGVEWGGGGTCFRVKTELRIPMLKCTLPAFAYIYHLYHVCKYDPVLIIVVTW